MGKKGGKPLCAFELKTAGEAKAVKLAPDLTSLPANGRSLSHVEVLVADDAGNRVPSADNLIAFEISGPGRLVGVDSGDVRSHELFKTTSRKAYQGRCLAVLESTGIPGVIKLTATTPGLRAGQISITAT